MRLFLLTFTVILAIALVRSKKLDASVCQSAKPCYCQLSESSYIDLTPIASKRLLVKTGTIVPKTYEIQLCSSFTKKECSNVLGCQENLLRTYAIGSNFNFINKSLVELQNGAEGRLTKITLDCGTGTDSNLKFENESPKKTYNFKLTSPYACVNTVPPTTTPSPATNSTTTTPHSSNSTTHTTVPTNTTTVTTHSTNTTSTTHASNTTTATTHASNTTTATTPASNTTTATTPASNTTTATTHVSNTTTVTTLPTLPSNSTTASTSPSTQPTSTSSSATTHPSTTAPPTTTHKGGASNITSFNIIFLLITGFIISKTSL